MTSLDEAKARFAESHARLEAVRAEIKAKEGTEMRALAEAQRPEIQTDLDNVREALAIALDNVGVRAQKAWDDGLRLLTLRFPLAPEAAAVARHLPDLADEYRILDEIVWTDALNRVLTIGWQVHTWTVGRNGHPIPLFERRE